MKIFFIVILILLCIMNANAIDLNSKSMRKLTVDQARKLVLESLTSKERQLPGLVIYTRKENSEEAKTDYDKPYYPKFYIFGIIWEGGGGGALYSDSAT